MKGFHKLEFHMTRLLLGEFGTKLYILQLDDKQSNVKIHYVKVDVVDLYYLECL